MARDFELLLSIPARVEIFSEDVGEWFWRDSDTFMGPWGTRAQAEADARKTYARRWRGEE